jgi:glycosyltransferase involved in cell wall biosynthesis
MQYPWRELRNGVSVNRFPLSSFGKRSIAVRLLAQFSFLVQATARAVFARRFDALLVSTSPPFAGFFGALLSLIRGTPFLWWVMDINPDQMVISGKLSQTSLFVRAFDWMNRVTLRRATAVVTLDDYMAETLYHKVDGREKTHVIPPWSHNTPHGGTAGDANPFRMAHGLQGRFIVMYAGNHALQHPLDTLLDAAKELEHDKHLVFVFVGGGAGKAAVEERIRNGAKNIVSLPYQPLEMLDECLAAADVHVVSMGNDMVGIVHPCKIYGAMAAARPVLAFSPHRSHIGSLLATPGIGWQIDHDSVSTAVAILRAALASPRGELDAMGDDAAERAARLFAPQRLIARFCSLLSTV